MTAIITYFATGMYRQSVSHGFAPVASWDQACSWRSRRASCEMKRKPTTLWNLTHSKGRRKGRWRDEDVRGRADRQKRCAPRNSAPARGSRQAATRLGGQKGKRCPKQTRRDGQSETHPGKDCQRQCSGLGLHRNVAMCGLPVCHLLTQRLVGGSRTAHGLGRRGGRAGPLQQQVAGP